MKRKKNVLIIAVDGLIGGVEKLFMAALPLLRQKGYDFIFCLDEIGPAAKAYQDLGFKSLVARNGRGKEAVGKIADIIHQYKIKLVHNNEFYLPAAIAAKNANISHLLHLHGKIENILEGYPRRLMGKKVSSACKLSNFAIGCSQYVINQLNSYLPPSKMACIQNGVPIKKIYNRQSTNGSIKTVGMVANFYPLKRHKDFILAAKYVLDRGYNANFFIAGNCWVDDEEQELYAQNLKKLVIRLGLKDRFTFYRGVYDLTHLYKQMDIFVLPSTGEGLSIAILEAMQYGLPVVVTKQSFSELVSDGQNGFLVSIRKPKEVAQTIIRILNDENLSKKVGQNARKTVEDRFNINRFVEELDTVYRRLL